MHNIKLFNKCHINELHPTCKTHKWNHSLEKSIACFISIYSIIKKWRCFASLNTKIITKTDGDELYKKFSSYKKSKRGLKLLSSTLKFQPMGTKQFLPCLVSNLFLNMRLGESSIVWVIAKNYVKKLHFTIIYDIFSFKNTRKREPCLCEVLVLEIPSTFS